MTVMQFRPAALLHEEVQVGSARMILVVERSGINRSVHYVHAEVVATWEPPGASDTRAWTEADARAVYDGRDLFLQHLGALLGAQFRFYGYSVFVGPQLATGDLIA